MNNDLERWLNFINEDDDLSENLLISKMTYDKENKSFKDFICDKFIPEAKKYGFDFSFEDVMNFSENTGIQKLSIDDLQDIAGGSVKSLIAAGAVAVTLLSVVPVAKMLNHSDKTNDFVTITQSSLPNEQKKFQNERSEYAANRIDVLQDLAKTNISSNEEENNGKAQAGTISEGYMGKARVQIAEKDS